MFEALKNQSAPVVGAGTTVLGVIAKAIRFVVAGAILVVGLWGCTRAAAQTPAGAAGDSEALGRPEKLIVAGDVPAPQRDAMLLAARRFYKFWNTGDAALLRQAVSDRFIDHTLPPGRPQGPKGPAAASKAFLAAVPDLKCVVTQQLLVGDRVVSHLHFTGHFTGTFQGQRGAGQPINFIATDILAVREGKITDNWHLEDNLTLLQQMGLMPREPRKGAGQ